MFRRIILALGGALLMVGLVAPAQASADECTSFAICGRVVNSAKSRYNLTVYEDACSTTKPCAGSRYQNLKPGTEETFRDADMIWIGPYRTAVISSTGVNSRTYRAGQFGMYIKLGNRPAPMKWVVTQS